MHQSEGQRESDRRVGWFFDAAKETHPTPPGFPECSERVEAMKHGLDHAGLTSTLHRVSAAPASPSDLELVHSRRYIERVRTEAEAGRAQLSTGDTPLAPRSFEAASLAAGGALAVTDAVLSGEVDRGLLMARPPGHHAGMDFGMGFCLFNNAALAARRAQQAYRLGRILIVDWDVHHGNGTEHIFYRDPSVRFYSIHQHPWYPGTGSADREGFGEGEGANRNIPLPAGSDGDRLHQALENDLPEWLDEQPPELIIVSCGFDAAEEDPLGELRYKPDDFERATRFMGTLADRWCGGRMISVIEGGYNQSRLGILAVSHVSYL